MLLVPPFHVIIIADSSSFVKDQLANFGLFFLENIMNTKICNQCKLEKDFEQFDKDKNEKSGLKSYCKSCRRSSYQKVKKERTEKNLEWRNNNKDRYRAYMKEYEKNKLLNDPSFRIAKSVRGRVRKILLGIRKYKPTLELLGCTFEELKFHLESQFKENMSWDNYGKWHIDHIRPCASFDLTDYEQQKLCFNYKNLQPLWAEDNLKKSDKWIN